MAKYLVTGGAGFIGSHLTEALVNRGDQVTVLDNLSNGSKDNLKTVWEKIRFIEADVIDPKACKDAVSGVEYVFHEAAMGSVPRSVADPMATHEANATGTLQLLIAAKEAKVKRFVVAASSSGYGDTPELPKKETMPVNPFSPYAVSKLAQEQYCRAFSVSYGLETVALRYFNVYGPRQDPNSQYAAVVPKFFHAFLKNESPMIYGDGEQTRDFTFVGDVVEANIKASEFKGAAGEIANIAGGKRVSINELAGMISKLVGTTIQPKHLPARAGDIKHSLADVSRAKSLFGWTPTTSLEDGLKVCFDWYRANV